MNKSDGKKKLITIKGYRWNHPGHQKVLLLHGFGSAASKFELYVKPLIRKGYEVLAFDAPAHGHSEGHSTNAVEYSAMIKKVVALYGPFNSFLAHSFGGIALSLALEDLEHDHTTRIVFIAPATETSTAVDAAFTMLKLNDTEVRNEFEKLIIEVGGKPISWYSIRRAIKNINAEIMWLHDEDDTITPLSDALKVKDDNHRNINFVITKGLGHHKIYKDSVVKKQAVAFL